MLYLFGQLMDCVQYRKWLRTLKINDMHTWLKWHGDYLVIFYKIQVNINGTTNFAMTATILVHGNSACVLGVFQTCAGKLFWDWHAVRRRNYSATLAQHKIGISYGVPFGHSWIVFSPAKAMHDGTMVKTRWYDGTMMKTRWYDGENTMLRWWNRDDARVRWWKLEIISCFHHRTIVISPSSHRSFTIVPSPHRIFVIVPSRFHHRTTMLSSSYHRAFVIVPSWFRHRTIVVSPSYHRVFVIVPSR